MVKRIDYGNGFIEYRNENDELHREDGPAIIYPDGSVSWWYLNGVEYLFNDWIENLNISGEEKMELVLKYG